MLGTGEPKVKRLKRKDMAAMDDASHSRRTWCLKCKSEGKASFAFKGSLSDKRNGLRHHMSQVSSLLSPPNRPPPRSLQPPRLTPIALAGSQTQHESGKGEGLGGSLERVRVYT